MAEIWNKVFKVLKQLVLFPLVFGTVNTSDNDVEKYPNIVLIAVNRIGLEDISYYREYLEHIRKLARDGINFTHVYSQLYPTSSRAALLTGRLPVKSGMLKGRFLPFTSLPSVACSGGMPLSELTLTEVLQRRGYSSKFVGLWDLGLGKNGKFLPLNQGFDAWFGILERHTGGCSTLPLGSAKQLFEKVLLFMCLLISCLFGAISLWYFRYLRPQFLLIFFVLGIVLYTTHQTFQGTSFISIRSCVLYRDNTILAQPYDVENLTLQFTEEAVQFIKEAGTSQVSPFFLTVHHPLFLDPLFNSRISKNFSGKDDEFLDSLMELDWSVGAIVGAIGELNLTENTVIIFTALSGLRHVNYSFGKSSVMSKKVLGVIEPDNWESHIRVPLYIKWKKKWKGGIRVNKTITLLDLMPTILEITDQRYFNENIDGKSLFSVINGNSSDLAYPRFVFHYLDVTRPSAVTYGKYKAFYHCKNGDGKVVYYDPPLLYDIMEDPYEMSILPANDFKEVLSNISEAIEKHLENRTRKWISQFEHPIYPWLFPCANFPYCYRTSVYKPNPAMLEMSNLQ